MIKDYHPEIIGMLTIRMSSFKAKTLLIGATKVGKTCIFHRVVSNAFNQDYTTTIGTDFAKRVQHTDEGQVEFQLWDTAGQEQFRSITSLYYKGSDIAILVYAVDDENSFKEISIWYSELEKFCYPMPLICIVGNKVDRQNYIAIDEQRALELANQYSCPVFQTSAKTGIGIDDVFQTIALEFIRRKKATIESDFISKNISRNKKEVKCC